MRTRSGANRLTSPWSEPTSAIIDPLLYNSRVLPTWSQRLATPKPLDPLAEMVGKWVWETWVSFCRLSCVNHSWRSALLHWCANQRLLTMDTSEVARNAART